MADDAEAPLESDSEEEDTEEEDKKTGEKRTSRRRITQNVSLSERRQSLTFAFAIIGAMIVLRHHWFGAALKWSKAPVRTPQPFARDEGSAPHPPLQAGENAVQ